jgi:membrane protein DedA with SNARE-associated domain
VNLAEILDSVGRWALAVITSLGYPGLLGLAFLETVFPPIPSEIVFPMAGSLTLVDAFNLPGVVLAGTAGALAGAWVLYGLGRALGEDGLRPLVRRYGKWLLLTEDDLDRALEWFNRYGEAMVFFARMVPTARSLISIPAGLVGMNPLRFTLYTAMGTALWISVLAYAGRILGQNWQFVSEFITQYQYVLLVLLGIAVAVFVVTRLRKRLTSES